MQDPYLAQWLRVTPDRRPAPLQPGVDYGMDPATGQFIWPKATPEVHKGQKFPGEMTTWDKQSYAKNVKVLAFYPGVGSPFHAWNNIADFEGRRYLYVHDRDYLRILDVTDPAKGKIVYSKGGVWGRRVRAKSTIRPTRRTIWAAPPSPGAKAGQARAGCVIRDRPLRLAERKLEQPDKVAAQRKYNSLKGFKVFAMDGPCPANGACSRPARRTTNTRTPPSASSADPAHWIRPSITAANT